MPADDRAAAEGASAPSAGDSGEIETLPDGSISIPILEERLVVQKQTFVRERIVVSKDVETTTERIEESVRKEQFALEADEQ